MRCTKLLVFSVVYGVISLAVLAGCSNSDNTSNDSERGINDRTLPFFQKPFQGNFVNNAPFDHDVPLTFRETSNDYILTWWGGHIEGVWNGHNGHDWGMHEGTPLLAVADGEVVYAGFEPPFPCGTLGETSALIVRLWHVAPNGEAFESLYVHLSRVDVEPGEPVRAGQQIGLSGMTGCANGPHLHFGVLRLTHTNNGQPVPIDPFGWQGDGPDPWAEHPEGAQSIWLWKKGQVPEGGEFLYKK